MGFFTKTKKKQNKYHMAEEAVLKYGIELSRKKYESELNKIIEEYNKAVQPYLNKRDELQKERDNQCDLILNKKVVCGDDSLDSLLEELEKTLLRIQGVEMAMTPLILNYNIKKNKLVEDFQLF